MELYKDKPEAEKKPAEAEARNKLDEWNWF
jgi:hypothetical protein